MQNRQESTRVAVSDSFSYFLRLYLLACVFTLSKGIEKVKAAFDSSTHYLRKYPPAMVAGIVFSKKNIAAAITQ